MKTARKWAEEIPTHLLGGPWCGDDGSIEALFAAAMAEARSQAADVVAAAARSEDADADRYEQGWASEAAHTTRLVAKMLRDVEAKIRELK